MKFLLPLEVPTTAFRVMLVNSFLISVIAFSLMEKPLPFLTTVAILLFWILEVKNGKA